MAKTKKQPSWDELYNLASTQDGLFAAAQAKDMGYSDQLLYHYVKTDQIQRVLRGVYRLKHFPPSEHEDLTGIWLWTERQAIFSHQTALALHDLSDILPSNITLTLPIEWKTRRVRFPKGVIPYYQIIPKQDLTWYGAIPVTTPVRTVIDCANAGVEPKIIKQAVQEGISRGLFSPDLLAETLSICAALSKSKQKK